MGERQIYHLAYERRKKNTAGSKAPQDITKICNDLGFTEIKMPAFPSWKNTIYKKIWLLTKAVSAWKKVYKTIPSQGVIIYQHPGYGIRLTLKYITKLQRKKGCKAIALIHDLESLRKGIEGVISNNEHRNEIGDNTLLKRFDAVICHNSRMKAYLISQGMDPDKLIPLELFDYIAETTQRDHIRSKGIPSIVIAGNLAEGKSGYIYRMTENHYNSGIQIHLFGINYDVTKKAENIVYHGSLKPEELVKELEADFGLVWDGSSAESCTGNTGEYLRYNNPHKTSLYLAAGIPVIVWKEAAIADFVEKNRVGIAIGNLYELEEAVKRVSSEEYETMCNNAREISKKVLKGQFFQEAIEKALKNTCC